MKHTKKALLSSALSMLLCCSMLIGSTFAWFTDSVTSGRNKIVAGDLDVELEYATADAANDGISEEDWKPVKADTNLFKDDTLWEPGHTEYVYLRVHNVGSLALKYNFSISVYGDAEGGPEKEYTSMATDASGEHKKVKLSQFLVARKIDKTDKITDRTSLWLTEGEADVMGKLSSLNYTDEEALGAGETDAFTLAVYMPTSVGNEANWVGKTVKPDEEEPKIFLGLTVSATQVPSEKDSFNDQYDEKATIPVNDIDALLGALNSIPENGVGGIVLENDFDLSDTPLSIEDGREVIIDVGGNELTAGADSLTVQGGTLTLTDSTGEGAVNLNSDQAFEATLNVLGTSDQETVLNIENVTVDVEGSGTARDFTAGIYVEDRGGKVTVNLGEGTVINIKGSTKQSGVNFQSSGCELNIADGAQINLISGAAESTAVSMNGGNVLNMSGGSIKVSTDTKCYGVEISGGEMKMTGGTIEVTGSGASDAIHISMSGTMNMSGGTINVATDGTGYGMSILVWGANNRGNVHLSGDAEITVTGSNKRFDDTIQKAMDDPSNENFTDDTTVEP